MAHLHQSPRREPWRDRRQDLPDAPRARDRGRRRVLRRRPGRLHTRVADEAYRIGPGPADESYLRGDVIVETALRAGAEAIHPGYGFLAENASFARAVEDAGLTWIGPPPAAIELMGSKTEARAAMRAAGVPIIPGATDPVRTVEEVVELGEEIGYPLIIKAAAGGGGKGMELVSDAGRGRAGVRGGAAAGSQVLRRRHRLRRALPREPAARRGADPRRRARHRALPRRARLHDPAAAPEARRGDAVARRRCRAAREDRRDRRQCRAGRRATARPARSRGCSPRTASTSSWR